jgi:hypothetical protein
LQILQTKHIIGQTFFHDIQQKLDTDGSNSDRILATQRNLQLQNVDAVMVYDKVVSVPVHHRIGSSLQQAS